MSKIDVNAHGNREIKMGQTDSKISRIVAVLLTCAMFLFAPYVQSQTQTKSVSGTATFDHAKTGFLLKDVHKTLKCEQCHVDGIFKNTPKACSGCHATGTRVAATPRPINHVPTPTSSDCDTCHVSATNFQVKSYNHVGITGGCSNCHNGVYLGVVSKSPQHFPTQLPCESCHTNTSSFLSLQMNHTGITNNCFTCHGGPAGEPGPINSYPNVTSYNPATHVPLSAYATPPDCNTCHTNFSSFLGANFDHIGVTPGTCGTCHKSQYPNVVSINPATHIGGVPAAACDTCHSGYASFLGATYSHVGVTAACSTCHTGQYTGVVSLNASVHIPYPTGTACDTCHTNTLTGLPGSTSPTFNGVVFHQNAMGSGATAPAGMTCGLCHSGSFVSQNATGKGTAHVTTTSDCVTCHTQSNTSSYTTFAGAAFSHATVAAGSCGTCHQGQYSSVVSIDTSIHIPQSSGNACDTCHTNGLTGLPSSTTPTFLGVVFHKSTLGNPPTGACSTCHSGAYLSQNAQAKNLGHVTTTSDCKTCHINTTGYTTFLGASFSHTPGTYATFPTGSSATPACSTCHNGTNATGKAATHVVTTGDCLVCHTTNTTGCPNCTTFLGAQYDHSNATTGVAAYTVFPTAGSTPTPRCDSCHGSTALGKNAGHVPTTADCMTCHTPSSTGCGSSGLCSTFLGATFSHTGIAAGTCGTCHQGQYSGVVSINPSRHIPQSSGNACDTCHTAAISRISTTTPTFLGVVFHKSTLGNPPTGTCSTCHSGAYISENALGQNAGHVTTSSDCVTCHTASNTASYTSFLGASFSHTPGTYATFPTGTTATPTCSSCHNGATATGKVATHVSTTGDCLVCHTTSTTGCPNCSTFYGVQYNHTNAATGVAAYTTFPVTGSTPSPRCDSCHNGSIALGKNSVHVPTTSDCMSCHTPASTGCGTTGLCSTFLGATFSHAGIAAGTCGTCHQSQYLGVVSISTAHVPLPSGSACDTCHTNALTGLPGSTTPTFLGVVYHKTTLGNPPSVACSSCHSGAYLSENALAKNTGHVTTTSDCVACHTATNTASYTSFLGANFSHVPGTYSPTFPTGTTAAPTCSSCHNGATATGKVATHVATTGDCLVCHTTSTTGCSTNCTTFFGVQYDHSNATTGVAAYTTFPVAGSTPSPRCDSCHGSTALGKSAGHVPTTADCITCHTPANTGCGTTGLCSTFLGATFVHTGIAAGTCGTCHQGQYASVVSINTSVHIPQSSGNACDACHTNTLTGLPSSLTPTFNGVVFHQNALGNPPAGTCTSCHSGTYVSQNAQAKISGHVTTTADCVSCHTSSNTSGYTTFLGASFSHSPGTYASFPSAAPASPLCGSCHNGTTAKGKSAGHITTTADCINCHTNGSTGCPNCSTFLGAATAPHTVANGFSGTCLSCHNGSTATGLSANPSHIPVGGIDCGQCHSAYDGVGSINFSTSASASGTYAGVSKYTMNHTGLTGTCGACHSGSYASQGVYGAQGKVSNHILTTIVGSSADCTSCHKTFGFTNFAITGGVTMWQAPAYEKMNHNNLQGGGAGPYCVTCHQTGSIYLVPNVTDRPTYNHNNAGVTKDCSRSNCHRPIGTVGTTYSQWN